MSAAPPPLLSLTHLNADATFTLTHLPTTHTLLLDPWLTAADAPVFSRHFSTQTRPTPALPAPAHIDAVLVSQSKSDHCHLPTLRTLPVETPLYCVPAAAGALATLRPRRDVTVLRPNTPVWLPLGGGGDGVEAQGWVQILSLPRPGLAAWARDPAGVHGALGLRYYSADRTRVHASVLFAPHGCPRSCVSKWLEGAETLEVLLFPWNRVELPFWLGGLVSFGERGGREVVTGKGVKEERAVRVGAWVSCHDEKKEVTGFVARWIDVNVMDARQVGAGVEGCGVRCVSLGVGEVLEVLPALDTAQGLDRGKGQ
ncbi:hypothetical protein EDC01DRAFT_725265 [Geopyxis carbonaria]|nr:hypothetical protein EDC01DRAFT_725265 [Geopyxis carbonaria]